MKKPTVGRLLVPGTWRLPPLESVVERRSRIDLRPYLLPDGEETAPPPDGGYTDLAWLLLRHLQERQPEACERFLLSQIEGSGRDVQWFEKCFGIESAADWKRLERAIYARMK